MSSEHFDFETAGQLSTQLKQLAWKIEQLVNLREGRRKALLGEPGSINWQGAKRDTFNDHFGRQQTALKLLAEAATSAKATVDNDIVHAHQARKAHH